MSYDTWLPAVVPGVTSRRFLVHRAGSTTHWNSHRGWTNTWGPLTLLVRHLRIQIGAGTYWALISGSPGLTATLTATLASWTERLRSEGPQGAEG